VTETAKVGGNAAERTVSQLAQLEHIVNISAQVIVQLGQQSQQIGRIVATISGIVVEVSNQRSFYAAIQEMAGGSQHIVSSVRRSDNLSRKVSE
jgi:methyl-accepting chemotaxis protein